MVELADAPDSKSGDGDIVRVRFPPSAPARGSHYGRKKSDEFCSSVFYVTFSLPANVPKIVTVRNMFTQSKKSESANCDF